MQALNSLTDEYSEPMELVPTSTTVSAPNSMVLSAEQSPEKTGAPNPLDDPKTGKDLLIKATVLGTGGEELMETKSFDNLASASDSAPFKERREGGPAETDPGSYVKKDQPQLTSSGSEAMIVEPTPAGINQSEEKGPSPEENAGHTITTDTVSTYLGKTAAGTMEELAMQVDGNKDEGLEVDGDGDESEERSMDITREDIQLLAELFYLPFEHGPRAYWIVDEFLWLKANGGVMRTSKETGSAALVSGWLLFPELP